MGTRLSNSAAAATINDPTPGRGLPPGLSDWTALWNLVVSGGVAKATKLWWQSRWNAAEMKAFQDLIVRRSNELEDRNLGRPGEHIFRDDEPDNNRKERIYHAALASQAVYKLRGGMSKPDNVTKEAWRILEHHYIIQKKDYWNIPFIWESPKDWILCSPKNREGLARFHVFSVKGSVGADDWLDNLNAGNNPRFQRGLLKEGVQMQKDAAKTLRELLDAGERVVFTGHSAGGAVAAYVYKELYREAVKNKARWNMDCVVFGCAATSDRQVTYPVPGINAPDELGIKTANEKNDDTAKVNNNTNIRIAFCNRWDPVPRATTSYVNWFLENWNAYHALPNKAAAAAAEFQTTRLPTDSLIPFGQLVTLTSNAPGWATKARWLTPDDFRQLVYLDPTQHSMTLYLKHVFRLLKQSRFGGIDPAVQ